MSSIIEVLFRDYVGSLRVSAPSVAVVNVRLQKAAPPDMSAEEKKALKNVGLRADDVAEVLAERDRLAPAKVRPLLITFVSDWTSFCDALAAKGRVWRGTGENRAEEIYVSLFPNGMDFAQTDAETAWSEGYRLLDRIEKEDLGSSLDTLLGPEFLAAVTASTEALGNGIGTGSSDRTTPSTTGLSEALFRFGRAVGRYGRQLAASCDEDDEESVARFMKAVAPIDVHRAGMRADGSKSADDTADQATTPVATAPATTHTTNGSAAAPSATSNGSVAAPATSNGAVPAPTTNGGNGVAA